jgi:hypothetical protein
MNEPRTLTAMTRSRDRRRSRGRLHRRDAGVVHQDVDAGERADRLGDGPLDVG